MLYFNTNEHGYHKGEGISLITIAIPKVTCGTTHSMTHCNPMKVNLNTNIQPQWCTMDLNYKVLIDVDMGDRLWPAVAGCGTGVLLCAEVR